MANYSNGGICISEHKSLKEYTGKMKLDWYNVWKHISSINVSMHALSCM